MHVFQGQPITVCSVFVGFCIAEWKAFVQLTEQILIPTFSEPYQLTEQSKNTCNINNKTKQLENKNKSKLLGKLPEIVSQIHATDLPDRQCLPVRTRGLGADLWEDALFDYISIATQGL